MRRILLSALFLPSICLTASLLITGSCSAASWADFNGYFAGMAKNEAKKLGYSGCHYGQTLGETSDSIYCDIPSAKQQLGGLQITMAKLEFSGSNQNRVYQIRLAFNALNQATKSALESKYGTSSYCDEDECVWHRNDGQTIRMNLSHTSFSKSTYATFSWRESTNKSRKQHLNEEKKKADALSRF